MKLAVFKRKLLLVLVITIFSAYSAVVFYVGSSFKEKVASNFDNNQSDHKVVERPTPQEEVQSASVLSSNVKLCANTVSAFEVAYPSDWFTTYNLKEDECTFFAPYSFVLPTTPESYFTPVTIKKISPDEWESTINSFKNPSELYNVVLFKNIEIGGKPVKYIEATSTGNSQPRGFYKITYLVFDSEKPLEITYYQQSQGENLDSYKRVLEDLVESLRFF